MVAPMRFSVPTVKYGQPTESTGPGSTPKGSAFPQAPADPSPEEDVNTVWKDPFTRSLRSLENLGRKFHSKAEPKSDDAWQFRGFTVGVGVFVPIGPALVGIWSLVRRVKK